MLTTYWVPLIGPQQWACLCPTQKRRCLSEKSAISEIFFLEKTALLRRFFLFSLNNTNDYLIMSFAIFSTESQTSSACSSGSLFWSFILHPKLLTYLLVDFLSMNDAAVLVDLDWLLPLAGVTCHSRLPSVDWFLLIISLDPFPYFFSSSWSESSANKLCSSPLCSTPYKFYGPYCDYPLLHLSNVNVIG